MASSKKSAVTTADRQRDREARGIRSRAAAFGSDRPSPPRRRRPALIAVALVLIVGGAALAGLLAVRLDARQPHLVVAHDVPVGTQITREDLATTQVSGDADLLIAADDIDDVLGTYARVPLSQGQLLDTSMLTTAEPFGDDVVTVGLPLEEGRVPVDLRSGDEVRLVRTGDGSGDAQPLATALIISTSSEGDDGGLTGGSGASQMAVVLVPVGAADVIVDAAGNDRIGISLLRRGVAADDADFQVLAGESE